MKPWPLLLALVACVSHDDDADDPPVDDTDRVDDTDTDLVDDTDDLDDTDARGPVERFVGLGLPVIDPEFFADERLVVWQAPDTSVAWMAEVDARTGLWIPSHGRGLRLGQASPMQGTADAPPTFNGPEWGDGGNSVFFTVADDQGFNQPARYERGTGQAVILGGGDGVHRNGVIPQLTPADERVAMLYFRGTLDQRDFAWRSTDPDDVDHVFPGASSADPTPRWIAGEDAIAVLVADDDGFAQVARYDLDSGETTVLTDDGQHKFDPFFTTLPDGTRVLTTGVSDTVPDVVTDLVPARIAVYHEVDGVFVRQVTFGVEETYGGGPYAHGSIEPFLVDGELWVSFVAIAGVARSTPCHVYVARADGTDVTQVTRALASRGDPEVVVIDGEPLLYYSDRSGSFTRVRVVRRFLPR